jgi:site-specific recombinase XerD
LAGQVETGLLAALRVGSNGSTPSAARKQLHHAAATAGVRRRFAPHQLRHAHAIEMAHEVSHSS